MASSYRLPTSTNVDGVHLKAAFDRFISVLAKAFNAYATARSRSDQIDRLNAKSDEQLAEMGLKREDIPRYVFRDLFYF